MTSGEVAVLNIHEVKGRLTCNGVAQEFSFGGIERLKIGIHANHLEIDSPWQPHTEDFYRVSIKETTTFSESITVPANALCKIEVTVAGSRKKIFTRTPTISQWRASQFSVPAKAV